MKLVASALAAASLAFTSTVTSSVWTSNSNYQACGHETTDIWGVGYGAELCTEKFFTITNEMVFGEEVAEACANMGAFPWCPESEDESVNVYANLAVLEYTDDQGNLDVRNWATEGISSWTGVQVDLLSFVTKDIDNYVCPTKLKSSNGVMTYSWNSDSLDKSIFNNEEVIDQGRKCVAMGEQLQFKWGHMHCGPWRTGLKIIKVPEAEKRRAVCVTVDDMSSEEGYAPMDMDAPEQIKNEIRKMLNALRNAAIFLMLFMTFIFTGCCFCCCFCCCCKPCRGGDSTPVVTQTIVQQQAAVPAPAPVQQFAPAPAPAPMMPAYAPPMQQVPAYNPYAQPMQQQQPMGGLNLNISNNNTNTN